MTHEFKEIIYQAVKNQDKGFKNILATVVFLEGSSYRKPGVRMLLSENGEMVSAVSGGCVENEIKRRAQSVFKDHKAKVITYDGRYRLGCEGILYILIEQFVVTDKFLSVFQNNLDLRKPFKIESYYTQKDEAIGDFGSVICFENSSNHTFKDSIETKKSNELQVFSQTLKPSLKLLIIGGEHDAVKLCSMASLLGWEVAVITAMKDPKQFTDFPGAKAVTVETPEIINFNIDTETVVVLMTHNYAQDLKYLIKLREQLPKYIGILGATKRRERLFSELFEIAPDLTDTFLDRIYTPAGLNLGAETPEEIAISIIAEIFAVTKKKDASPLRAFNGKINV